MQRRNFIIGAGALATGTAAAVGTGAFSSVEASRDVSVEVADDAQAYLAIEATSAYAEENDDGLVEISFDDLEEDGEGEHVGEDSRYFFGSGNPERNVFQVRNQGDQTVELVEQQHILRFDKDGNPTDEEDDDTELLIVLNTNNAADGGIELSPGDREGYYIQISTVDDPPSSVDATFELNAEEV